MNSQLLSQIEAILGPGGVLSQADDLMVYECDAFVAAKRRPDIVVFPTTTEEVSALVKLARKNNLVVVPRGAGTGLAGGSLAESGCMMIATSRMNQILEVDIPNRCALVEAGVVNLHLQQMVAPQKYCFTHALVTTPKVPSLPTTVPSRS